MTHASPAILIVEDERIVAEDLQQSLTDMGYDAFAIAASAEEAVACASVKCPDVLLMDIRIQGPIDGIEAAAILQKKFPVIVIYLTAFADERMVERAKKTEPDGYLLKPVKTAELRSMITLALYKRDLQDAREKAAQMEALMARRATERAAELEELNHALREESRERKRAEEETRAVNRTLEFRIEEQTRELQLANQELETFSYSVAHDLRAPLRAISAFSDALTEECGSNLAAEGVEFIDRIRAACIRMGILIDGILELSRLTRSDMWRENVDLSGMARDILETLAIEQPRSAVVFSVQDGQSVEADPKYLRIALENLLGNAWKFTAKTPDARIEFGRLPDGNETGPWFVRDNGAGFDMEYADKLFELFQRLHSESEFPGYGVGLATTQRIILKHGGKLWATAEPGRGATFFFTIETAHA